MLILRLILIFLLFLVLRRVFRALFLRREAPGPRSGRRSERPPNGASGDGKEAGSPLDELTQQDISDADFEEIP